MDGPYASQPQEIPQIFRDEASPWRIFVSANGINGRPKLVRTLKKAGAVICSDPKQANVILVDATSDAGREFIREWGGDTDKVVLQHMWVAACISASKVLGKDDEWGGFLTFDDGLPIAKEGTEPAEDTIKSPLPTPRITPVEAPSSASSQSASTRVPDIPFRPQPSLQDTIPDGSFHAYPPNNPFANQQMYQQAYMMHPAFMAQMQQQTFAQPNSMPVFQHPTGPNGPVTPYSAGMGPFNLDMYNMNLNSLYGTFNRNMMFPPQDSPNGSSPPNPTDFNSSTVPPSFRRKSPILSRSTPTSYTSGSQMRSISPTSTPASMFSQSISQRTPSRSSSLSGALFRSKDGRDLSFFVQVDLSNRSRTVTAIKKNGGKIVSSNKTADYAILYSQSKTFDQLLESTILAGKPAVSAAFVQDCVDQNKLLRTSSYEFETSKSKSATPRGKRKRIKSEEEEEDDSLDDRVIAKRLEKDYSRRARKDPAMLEDEVSPIKKAVAMAKAASPTSRNTHQCPVVQSDDPSRLRSPTPPPEHTRIKRGGSDGYMYSEQERDYAKRYVKVLLQRDHQISNSAIGKALYIKMDNHSLGSWRTFLTQEPFRSVVDGMRKTAGIEFRKQLARGELLAKEVETVAQFFATGAGRSNPDEEDDGNDAVAWERLTQQTKCQSCASWTDWYSDHHAKVEKRYQELLAST